MADRADDAPASGFFDAAERSRLRHVKTDAARNFMFMCPRVFLTRRISPSLMWLKVEA
jgi:hypothetical protein